MNKPQDWVSSSSGLLYAATIFLSAFLVFEVQPVIAHFVLPWFGGSAAVWTTCMLFFQTALVLGYLYGFVVHRGLGPRAQGALHAALLAGSLLLLPITPNSAWRPAGSAEPIGRILLLLLRSVGLPYVLLSATGPLLQSWFVAQYPGRNPYRLFALSNLASMLALLGYPLVVEPLYTSPQQAKAWSLGYGGFVLLCGALALGRARARVAVGPDAVPTAADAPQEDPVPRWQTYLLWLLLPACASMLLLSITNHLTQDLAAIPLLWILPLCLYLLTFILCFEYPGLYRRAFVLPALALALGAMAYLRWPDARTLRLPWQLAIFSAGLFICCMVCHGELVRRKPVPERLTLYYLLIALGGALGASVVGVAAPLLLSSPCELELGLAACGLLSIAAVLGEEPARAALSARPSWVIGLGCSALSFLLFLAISVGRSQHDLRRAARNFYGSLRVLEVSQPGTSGALRMLFHGTTFHGSQWQEPRRAREPTTYYCADSGPGLALALHHPERPRHLGVIGLGTGTLAAYGRAGDRLRFYELNPQVFALASQEFTYLRDATDAGAGVQVVLGDARLSLLHEPPQGFDVLLVDAFAGDSIPVHLLTREAFELYRRHLSSDGVLAVHISNRHLDLEPVVAAAAAALGMQTRLVTSEQDQTNVSCYRSIWVLLTTAGELFTSDDFADARPAALKPGFRAWTDQHSNLMAVLR